MDLLDSLNSIFKNTIVLDEEAFQTASADLLELAGKIDSLRQDIEEMLSELQGGFDTPAGHQFVSACQTTLLDTLEKQKIVVEHVSKNLETAKSSYQSVFDEYRSLQTFVNSD